MNLPKNVGLHHVKRPTLQDQDACPTPQFEGSTSRFFLQKFIANLLSNQKWDLVIWKNIFQYLCFICTSSRRRISSWSVSNIQCSGAKMAHGHRKSEISTHHQFLTYQPISTVPLVTLEFSNHLSIFRDPIKLSWGVGRPVASSRERGKILHGNWALRSPWASNETGSDMHGLCLYAFRSVISYSWNSS